MKQVLAVSLCLFAVAFVVGHCTGCAPKAEYPMYCTDEKLFTGQILLCTQNSDTREASRECKRLVNKSCGFVETVGAHAHE